MAKSVVRGITRMLMNNFNFDGAIIFKSATCDGYFTVQARHLQPNEKAILDGKEYTNTHNDYIPYVQLFYNDCTIKKFTFNRPQKYIKLINEEVKKNNLTIEEIIQP